MAVSFVAAMKKDFKHLITFWLLLMFVAGPHAINTLYANDTANSVNVISKIKFKNPKLVSHAHVISNPSSSDSDLNAKHEHVIENENEEFECSASKKFVDNLYSFNKLLNFQSPYSIYIYKSLQLRKEFSFFAGYQPALYILFEVYRI